MFKQIFKFYSVIYIMLNPTVNSLFFVSGKWRRYYKQNPSTHFLDIEIKI